MSNFPIKQTRNMLHALGISHHKNGDYIQPNKRYSPYPTSYRNYYQVGDCGLWNDLVEKGYAKKFEWCKMNYYLVTDEGKKYLQDLGYKWHQDTDLEVN